MKGDGNGWSTLLQKLYFMVIPTAVGRSNYIKKHEYQFKHIGNFVHWQPRVFPTDPEMISIGNNVRIASGVEFVNHDGIYKMLNRKFNTNRFVPNIGCIEIGDNVEIGSDTIILPNVKIGSNIIIGSGSIVTKDIPDNSVAVGVPCRVIGDFKTFVEKYGARTSRTTDEWWEDFYNKRK